MQTIVQPPFLGRMRSVRASRETKALALVFTAMFVAGVIGNSMTRPLDGLVTEIALAGTGGSGSSFVVEPHTHR